MSGQRIGVLVCPRAARFFELVSVGSYCDSEWMDSFRIKRSGPALGPTVPHGRRELQDRAALGRLLNDEDDRVEGAHAVCVLSYAAWRSRFSSDPRVLERVVRINTHPVEIVGVAGPDFVGAELQKRYDIWAPTAMTEQLTWNARNNAHAIWLGVLAKLRPGMAFGEARARLKAASKGINKALPKQRANADVLFDFVEGSKGYDSFRTRFPLTTVRLNPAPRNRRSTLRASDAQLRVCCAYRSRLIPDILVPPLD